MKVISLNTWGGRIDKTVFYDFFKKHGDVDIFCLQEIWEGGDDEASEWGEGIDTSMFTNLGKILKEHSAFFRPSYREFFGLAMFVKKNLKIVEEGEIFVFKNKENVHDVVKQDVSNHARNLQYMTVETEKGTRTILNLHGLWNGNGKRDCDERISQSERISSFIKSISNPYVLVGDFNLLPETRSLKILEDLDMRNLIKENNVTSTRTRFYTKSKEKFADYALVSKDIEVKDFKVLPDEVSDHTPLYLEFE